MKKHLIFVCLVALGLGLRAEASATDSAQAPHAIASVNAAVPPAAAQMARSFTGRISFASGKYVLASDTSATFQLDDQERAKEYYGKSVRVSGILDASTNTILVADIQAT